MQADASKIQEACTSEAVGKLADAKNAEILERMNEMREREWLDRKTVLLNAYANILTDEASMMVQMMETGVIPACAEDLKSYEGTDLAGERDVADECSTVMSMRKWATDVESTVAQRFEACAHEMKTTNVRLTELKDLKSQMHLEILNASAQDKTTGELNQISVIYERESLFPAEIHRMVQQAEKYREEVCCAQQQEQQQAQQQEQQHVSHVFPFRSNPSGRPMADHAGAGFARRRRERRLRSWWRHERMSIACALAEALHHSSGSPEYDRRRVGVAQHGAVRGQTTATRARGPGTQYFTFDDEDVPASQERELQRIVVYVDAPSLDVPALQRDEEANAFLLAPLLHSQEQVIVQEIPADPVASSLVRAVQPVDVEPVLDVPVLHTDGDDPGISSDELDRMLLQCDIRDYLVARGPGLFGSERFVEQTGGGCSRTVALPARCVSWFWLSGTGGECSRTTSCTRATV